MNLPLLCSIPLKSTFLEPNYALKEVKILGLDTQNKIVYFSIAHVLLETCKNVKISIFLRFIQNCKNYDMDIFHFLFLFLILFELLANTIHHFKAVDQSP